MIMGRFDEIAEKSAQKTDAQLASEISGLTRLTDIEISKLFPQKVDKERLVKLLEIVKESTDENDQINKLTGSIKELAGTAIKLIKLFL